MNKLTGHAPLLVFAYGNPSRGDDAIGPAMYNLLGQYRQDTCRQDSLELLTDYQLQIEHAVDLEQRECALFIDASVSCPGPYIFHRLWPQQDDSYTTHAQSPAAVLAVYRKINQQEPPLSYMLSIRGYEFGLGQTMTGQAEKNLAISFEFVKELLETDFRDWEKKF
ncbi:MAG: hydrogenase maturation protease [Arenicellales bacterium]